MTSHDAMDGERVVLQGGGEGALQVGDLTQRRGEAESAENK